MVFDPFNKDWYFPNQLQDKNLLINDSQTFNYTTSIAPDDLNYRY